MSRKISGMGAHKAKLFLWSFIEIFFKLAGSGPELVVFQDQERIGIRQDDVFAADNNAGRFARSSK